MIKAGEQVQLSERLLALAQMTPSCKTAVDVGCDHGYLDIHLVETGKCDHALAMDVRKGPLSAATAHIMQAGLSDRIETRLSDGLSKYQKGEGEVLICAGMGGPLMEKILTDDPGKTADFRTMILQPQSEIREFRIFLRKNRFRIEEERILLEDGKYYFPMRVVPTEDPIEEDEYKECYDRFGEHLLRRKEPLLRTYLQQQDAILSEIKGRLLEADAQDEAKRERIRKRLEEVEEEAGAVRKALELMA